MFIPKGVHELTSFGWLIVPLANSLLNNYCYPQSKNSKVKRIKRKALDTVLTTKQLFYSTTITTQQLPIKRTGVNDGRNTLFAAKYYQ